MTWVGWCALGVHVLACLGPFRRPFFRNGRFTIAASFGGWLAWLIADGVRRPEDPWWMPLGVAVFVALGAGTAAKEWLDNTLGGGR